MSDDMHNFFEDARNADSLIVAQEICGARLKKIAANEYAGPCPSCGGRDRFSLNVRKKTFNCRRCGAKGSNVDLAMLAFGCAAVEAAEKVNGRPRPNGSRDETEEERAVRLAKNAQRHEERQQREEEHQRRRRPRERATRRRSTRSSIGLSTSMTRSRPMAGLTSAARGLIPDKRLTGDIKFVPDLDYFGARENGSGEIVRLATLPAIIALIRDPHEPRKVIGLSRLYLDRHEARKWTPIGSPQNSARKI